MSGWSVVTIAREPLPVLKRFVAWHLSVGADHIHIYFDDPDDPNAALFEGMPRIEVTRCTPEFWMSLGIRPDIYFTRRQIAALFDGYKRVRDGWVLVIDADELVCMPDIDIGDYFRGLPAETRGVLVRTAERVRVQGFNPEETFRVPILPKQIRLIHGEFGKYLVGTSGLVGHHSGKSFTRAGLTLSRAHQHWMIDFDRSRVIDCRADWNTRQYLLHYYESGYESWRTKLNYRVQAVSRGRRDEILSMLRGLIEQGDEAGLRDVYRKFHELSAWQAAALQKRGAFIHLDLDLDARIARYFPESAPRPFQP